MRFPRLALAACCLTVLLAFPTATALAPTQPAAPSGPTSLSVNATGTYTATATDPEGDLITYVFEWDDGTTSGTPWVASGTSQSVDHSWSTAGTYCVRVYAVDSGYSSSTYSSCTTVTVSGASSSSGPNTPAAPSGPSSLDVGEFGAFTASTTDPQGDLIKYTFVWDDGTSFSSQWTPSGAPAAAAHAWSSAGTYCVRVQAVDRYGNVAEDSPCKTVVVSGPAAAPSTPLLVGLPVGVAEVPNVFAAKSDDAQGDFIMFVFSWGDGTTTGTVSAPSALPQAAVHTYAYAGNYCVRVEAFDQSNNGSGYSPCLMVTVV